MKNLIASDYHQKQLRKLLRKLDRTKLETQTVQNEIASYLLAIMEELDIPSDYTYNFSNGVFQKPPEKMGNENNNTKK